MCSFEQKKTERNIFLILDSKECFLDPKSEILTKSKNIDIFQRG